MNILHFIAMGWFNETFNYEYWTSDKYPFSIPFYPMVIGEEWRSESYQNHMVIMNHESPLSQWGNGYYTGVSPYPYTYPPALDFCDETHELGGIVVATHPFVFWEPFTVIDDGGPNRLAYEMPVDVALGRIDGMQIYCYGSHPWNNSQYDEWNLYVWYKLLNCGFRIPPFAGTDAYMNMTTDAYLPSPPPGKVRSYVYVPNQTDDLSYDDWINEAVRGRSFVSSGAVLFFTVNGDMPGTEISLNSADGTATVTVGVDARWMSGIKNISIIVNGEQAAYRYGNYQKHVVYNQEIKLTESSWIAARVEGSPFDYYNGDAHSGPVYVTLNNKPIHSPEDALYFADWIDKHIALLDSIDQFGTEAHKQRTFSLYREGQDVFRTLADTTSAAMVESKSAGRFVLFPNVPNPFNSTTLISFELPEHCHVSLEIYNVLGQQVKTIFTGKLDKGTHNFQVNMEDVGTGVYFLRLTAPQGKLTQRMLYIR